MALKEIMNESGYYFYPYQDLWVRTRNKAMLNVKIKDDKVCDFFIDTLNPISEMKEIDELKDNLITLQKDIQNITLELENERN